MLKQADTMRVMAEKYLRLAKMTAEPLERKRFLNYAATYAQLSERSDRQEVPITAAGNNPGKRR